MVFNGLKGINLKFSREEMDGDDDDDEWLGFGGIQVRVLYCNVGFSQRSSNSNKTYGN